MDAKEFWDLAEGIPSEYDKITKFTIGEYLSLMEYILNKKKQEATHGK